MSELKFCVNCKHISDDSDECFAPKNRVNVINLVTGVKSNGFYYRFCSVHRSGNTGDRSCNSTGKWYELKEPK